MRFLTSGLTEKEQLMVTFLPSVGPGKSKPTFRTCAFLCAPNLTCAALTITIIMYVSCQQSTQRDVVHKEGGCC